MNDDAIAEIDGRCDDVRRERCRRSLAQAVLDLAAERDITSASVSELARRANVNRTTFYAHAGSPTELLTRVLTLELDEVRRHTFEQIECEGILAREITRTTLRELMDHVLKHERIYSGIDRNSSIFALRVVLADHVHQAVLHMWENGFIPSPIVGADGRELAAGFLASGVAGAFEAWLKVAPPRDPQMLIEAIEAMYPQWYAPEHK